MVDLKEFQNEVFDDLLRLTSMFENAAFIEEHGYMKNRKKRIPGMLSKLLAPLSLLAFKKMAATPDFIEREKKVEEIINNPKVKEILCPLFKRKISMNFYTEELQAEVVIIVTESLIRKKNNSRMIDSDIEAKCLQQNIFIKN